MRPTRRSRRWMRRAAPSSATTWCASSRSPGATSPRRRAWPGATAPSSTGSWNAIPSNPACSRPLERPAAHYANDQGAGKREGADGVEAGHDAIAVGQKTHDQRGAEVRDAPTQPAERKRRTALLLPAGLRDGDLEVQGHGAGTEADEQHPEADRHGMLERRHQADRSRHGDSAQHRPEGLRSRAYEARSDQPGGYRAESAQREQDAGGPLAVAEVCEQQGVERDGKRKRQRREVGAKHR